MSSKKTNNSFSKEMNVIYNILYMIYNKHWKKSKLSFDTFSTSMFSVYQIN
jgi:hypothetical protein